MEETPEVHVPTRSPSPTFQVNVYLWLGDRDEYGHASLELSTGTYISWRPHMGSKRDPHPARGCACASLEMDMRAEREGKMWDKHYRLPVSKDAAASITEWWSNNKEGDYNCATNNCCHKVAHALEAGNVDVTSHLLAMHPYELYVALSRYVAARVRDSKHHKQKSVNFHPETRNDSS